MLFKKVDWLSGHGIWAVPCPTNMVSVRVNFWGHFYFHVSLVFHDYEGFLIKQLFHSRLLDMRWLKPTRRYAPRWISIISYPNSGWSTGTTFSHKNSRRILQLSQGEAYVVSAVWDHITGALALSFSRQRSAKASITDWRKQKIVLFTLLFNFKIRYGNTVDHFDYVTSFSIYSPLSSFSFAFPVIRFF